VHYSSVCICFVLPNGCIIQSKNQSGGEGEIGIFSDFLFFYYKLN
jgi:hypothetical protein